MVGTASYFLLQLKGYSRKLRNKNRPLVLVWEKIPEHFAFIHSMIFYLFAVWFSVCSAFG